MAGVKRGTEKARFLAKVRVAESGCWEWQAFKMKRNGYGFFRTPTRHELAHRVAYRLFVAPLIDGLDVMHSCDNPGCVNPEHLRQGTHKENMEDCSLKGRNSFGEKHGKLTDEQVKFAVESHLLQREVAEIIGCTQSYVSELRRGGTRKHLALPTRHKPEPRRLTDDERLMILSTSASHQKIADFIGCPYSTVQQLRFNAAKAAQLA